MRTINATLTSDLGAEADRDMAVLVQLDFGGSGILRFTSAPRPLTWNSQTWLALGGALTIGAPSEATDLDSQGIELTLSGVEQSAMALLLGETYRGRLATLWYGHWNPVTGAVVGTPLQLFAGYLNAAIDIDEDRGDGTTPGTATVTTRILSPLAVLKQRRGIRCNVDDHRASVAAALSAGDTFFARTADVSIRNIHWGTINPPPVVHYAVASGS